MSLTRSMKAQNWQTLWLSHLGVLLPATMSKHSLRSAWSYAYLLG